MRVARFWRMKQQNYRLSGFQYESGAVSMLDRPLMANDELVSEINHTEVQTEPEVAMVYTRKAS